MSLTLEQYQKLTPEQVEARWQNIFRELRSVGILCGGDSEQAKALHFQIMQSRANKEK